MRDILSYAKNVEILLFPEVFLHGYFNNEKDARSNSIDLNSEEFQKILSEFHGYATIVILGLNEQSGDKIYNTAVIIENGNLVGKVRKSTSYPPYDYYTLESQYPIFYKNNIGFSVCICCDVNYFNPSYTL